MLSRTYSRDGEDKVKSLIIRFTSEDSGQDLIEYGLLLGIITTASLVAIEAIGPKVASYFGDLNANLP
jgi:pilus assembly protein Flp/PilA